MTALTPERREELRRECMTWSQRDFDCGALDIRPTIEELLSLLDLADRAERLEAAREVLLDGIRDAWDIISDAYDGKGEPDPKKDPMMPWLDRFVLIAGRAHRHDMPTRREAQPLPAALAGEDES